MYSNNRDDKAISSFMNQKLKDCMRYPWIEQICLHVCMITKDNKSVRFAGDVGKIS